MAAPSERAVLSDLLSQDGEVLFRYNGEEVSVAADGVRDFLAFDLTPHGDPEVTGGLHRSRVPRIEMWQRARLVGEIYLGSHVLVRSADEVWHVYQGVSPPEFRALLARLGLR